jgi:hypothetical protein
MQTLREEIMKFITTFGELEALRLCEGRIPGCEMTTVNSHNHKNIAVNYILELAERIKNERVQALLNNQG